MGESLSGAVLDIVKAFNHLPTYALLATTAHLAVPRELLRAWRKALISLERRFLCRGCVGPGLMSSTGFAEGCGLSVAAMLVVNLVCHAWVNQRGPSCTLWSYVDNWDVIGKNQADTLASMHHVQEFADSLDLLIDHKKTYLWSTSAAERKDLRAGGHALKSCARELGGHVQYTKAHTHRTILDRLAKMPAVWSLMYRSQASYRNKTKAIRSKAWPRALHGAETIEVGKLQFKLLRTGATRGIHVHKLGMSPIAQLSLVEPPETDPYYFVVLRGPREGMVIFDEMALGKSRTTHRGPYSVFFKRMHGLGWRWEGSGQWMDPWRIGCALFACPPQEVRERLAMSWQLQVQGELSGRKTFKGITQSCPRMSTMKLSQYPAMEQGVLRAAWNGSFYTQDKHQGSDDSCVFCGSKDGQWHRHWGCPFFEAERELCPLRQQASSLPPGLTVHGWARRPPQFVQLKQALQVLPTQWQTPAFECSDQQEVTFFTDGSCAAPTCRFSRIASWAVVAAGTSDPWAFYPLARGPARGWQQTALCEKVSAIIQAVKIGKAWGRPFRVWTDNSRAAAGCQAIQAGETQCAVNHKDSDPWRGLRPFLELVEQGLLLGVHKVVSHQVDHRELSAAERWIIAGNRAADQQAEVALHEHPCRPQHLSLQKVLAEELDLVGHVQALILRIGKKVRSSATS